MKTPEQIISENLFFFELIYGALLGGIIGLCIVGALAGLYVVVELVDHTLTAVTQWLRKWE